MPKVGDVVLYERDVSLSNIRLDGDTQARVAIDADLVDEYAELMRAGSVFPKIRVVRDKVKRDVYWLVDGFHRVLAAKKARRKNIRADVSDGTRFDAVWMSVAANKSHGLRRTNADKQKAAIAAIKARPHLTDPVLAAHVGVSAPTIAKYRQELEDRGELDLATEREGADGRILSSKKDLRLEQIVRMAVRRTATEQPTQKPKHVTCALCNGKGKVKV